MGVCAWHQKCVTLAAAAVPAGGYCHPWTYLLGKATADGLLLRAIPALLYSLPFYYMMGLQTGSSHVALFLFTVATFALAVAALSLAVTSGRPGWRARRRAGMCCATHSMQRRAACSAPLSVPWPHGQGSAGSPAPLHFGALQPAAPRARLPWCSLSSCSSPCWWAVFWSSEPPVLAAHDSCVQLMHSFLPTRASMRCIRPPCAKPACCAACRPKPDACRGRSPR